ncbi:hypothetical protein SAMN02745166_00569 [Prosthecobacter debontii]|uniref:TIGR02597 family protein n=1 Tax=Prosthecobacter debontii TaxID=48467 RepID=A0A1T4WRU4_9BACT|nr:hypothetical protein [Prosthecobacter debontii]SKA79989.1 hypothetical protein SAMN02745166_00569 [Prosthecobacter debontii]
MFEMPPMKPQAALPWLAAAVLALTSASAQEAKTEPSGFQTLTVKGGNYSLIGINFLRPVLASGSLESATATSVTDAQGDFQTALPPGTRLWLELVDGVNQGCWSIITPIGATTLDTVSDLSAYVTAGVRYEIRAATTLADIFGLNNEAGLKTGNSQTADMVWVPKENGGFDKLYYAAASPPFLTAGWRMIGAGNADMAKTPIYHVEGIIIERRAPGDLRLTVSGVVKTTVSVIPITSGFNYLERSYPLGATLGNSGLATSLQSGTPTTADVIWLTNASGGYDKYYYAVAQPPSITAGWRAIGAGNADQAGVALTPGFIIERKAAASNIKLAPDSSLYGDL